LEKALGKVGKAWALGVIEVEVGQHVHAGGELADCEGVLLRVH